ncbi:acyltransferase family protein [Noviherbaspirillum aerium]|uniref:acyltransferase family protein n=1 Tax=Noviherbaspirillum aerium TaxID=2588497 RepID=UPI00124E29EC|nr:acyltransferase family protein [Noviherbaspirillum aerium]
MNQAAHLAYRPDIDGLRAIAVLAVIAFHASSVIVTGGFVGVDIFFVISGFLITGLIAKGMETGTFTFVDFYTRRIKRIFPAYILVALVTFIISSYLLIPNDYIFYTTSLAASWAFLSNVFFSMLSWGYFGQRTEEFPLLHTWSLSVEEQFYFLFPVVLMLLFRYCRKQIIPVLLAAGTAFAILSEFKTGEIKAYFLLTSRAHELIIGALAYFISQKYPLRSAGASNALVTLGMGLMLGSMFMIEKGTPFPGVNSLYPCIGTALVIYAGTRENMLRPLLASRPMVSVGLISYSLYLWHWPIFSFLRYRRIDITLWVGIGAVALAFLLSWLTWKYVETPVRKSKGLNFKKAFVRLYALPAAAFMSVGLVSYVTEGAPYRFSNEMRELISSYSFERDLTRSCSIRAEDYHKVTMDYLMANCAFGDTSRTKAEVLLMGDSHAHHFKPFVDALAKEAGVKAVYHVQGTCFPTALQVTDKHPEKGPDTCQQRNLDLLALAPSVKYVVMAGFWASEPWRDLEKEMMYMAGKIVEAGAIPVIFKDNPYFEPDLSQCILHRTRGWMPADRNCNIPYGFVAQTQTPVDQIIEKVQAHYPSARIIDPKKIMCTTQECVTYMGNVALYKDANHINTKASKLLGEQYVARVNNPLADASAYMSQMKRSDDVAQARQVR